MNAPPARPATAPPIASPCVDVCRMDEATGWCEGCLRTIEEIAAWGTLDDAVRRDVMAILPLRRAQRQRRIGG